MDTHDVTIVPVFSDLHAGSKVALMPPDGWIDEDGIEYKRSPQQKEAWLHWRSSWDLAKSIASKYKNPRYIVIANGDMVDGDHHGTPQIYTKSLIAQTNIAETIIKTGLDIIGFDKSRDSGYMVSGTPAHVGQAHEYEDDLAARLDFVPQRKGRYLHNHLKITIDGVNFDIAHHGGAVGKKIWTKNNGLNSIAQNLYLEAVDGNRKIPHWVLRSHLHQFARGRYIGRRGIVESCVLPSWQFKTHFSNKVAGDNLDDIGMLIFEVVNGEAKLHTSIIEYEEEKWRKS